MSDEIPMPSALTEEAVAAWIAGMWRQRVVVPIDRYAARAVLALVEAKVREAVDATLYTLNTHELCDEDKRDTVSRVMGRGVRRG